MDQLISTQYGNYSDYEIFKFIGRGRYGEVFEGFNITNNRLCAIKVLKSVKQEKVDREINVLRKLDGGPNIIKLRDVLTSFGTTSLVFGFVSYYTLGQVLNDLDQFEIKFYLFKLLNALQYTHEQVLFSIIYLLLKGFLLQSK